MNLNVIVGLNERSTIMGKDVALGKTSEQIPDKAKSFDTELNRLVSASRFESAKKPVERLKGKKDKIAPDEMEEIFEAAAKKNNVPLKLLKVMAKAESQFKPHVVSSAGAMGVMQLMPKTAKALGVVDAFDPYENIMGGAKYIGDKLKQYNGDIDLALASYSAGSGAVKKYGGIPPFKETINHIKKVHAFMQGDLSVPGSIHKGPKVPSAYVASNKQMNSNIKQGNADLANELSGFSNEYLKTKIAIMQQQLYMKPIFSDDENDDQTNRISQGLDLERDMILATLKNL